MPDNTITFEPIVKSITIQVPASKVWECITNPALMKQWMSETAIEIITTWEPGSSMIIQGDWYKAGFKNSGTVLQVEKEQLLRYSHLSSLSRLPDTEDNHTILEFRLNPAHHETFLELTVSNFPTEAIYRHFAFYWNVAIVLLKKFAEQ